MNAHATGANTARHGRLAAWRRQHAWCFADSLHQLARRPFGTGLTIVVMGLALALPLAFYLVLANLERLSGALGETQAVNVFLKPAVTADAAEALAQDLRARPDVAGVTIRTPHQGLDELALAQGFGEALKALPENPLPFVLLLQPRAGASRDDIVALARALRALPRVDLVQDDGQWRARLDALIALGRRATLLLALLLGAAAVLVIGNTVRLDVRTRADEIAVQQLVGASAGFVRRPYLYEGVWYGLAAGVIAVLLVLLMEAVLVAPVRQLAASYAGRLRFGGLQWDALAVAPVIAAALGWIGAWLASTRHLARMRPR
jgi:cell division transport system permease protein